MLRSRNVLHAGSAAAITAALLSLSGGAQAAEWYFYVQNSSKSTITRIEVKDSGGSWGAFDVGRGIASGSKVRIDWAASTSNQGCNQSIRATFADGSTSTPIVVDFCKDLESPIVFSD